MYMYFAVTVQWILSQVTFQLNYHIYEKKKKQEKERL